MKNDESIICGRILNNDVYVTVENGDVLVFALNFTSSQCELRLM